MLDSKFIQNKYLLFLLILISTGVYFNSLSNPYVWDDEPQIKNNAALKDFSRIRDLVTKDYYVLSREESYRPVDTFSLLLTQTLLGSSPFSQRSFNLFLHILTTLLVYFLLLGWMDRVSAWGGSLLFAVHPIHTEVLNCVSYRDELLMSLFFLSGFLLFFKGRKIWALVAYVLSLFSKEMGITLPVVVVLAQWSKLSDEDPRMETSRKCRNIISDPFVLGSMLIAIGYLVFRLVVLANPDQALPYPGGSIFTNAWTMGPIFLLYLKLLVVPTPLAVSYTLPVLTTPFHARFLLFLLCLFVLGGLIYYTGKKNRGVVFFSLWIVITLLPILNFIPFLENSLLFERYLYLPSVAASGLVGLIIFLIPRKWMWGIMGVVFLLFSLGTIQRNRDWGEGMRLYQKNLELYPNAASLYVFRGDIRMNEGNLEAAIKDFEKSLSLHPTHYPAMNALGVAYHRLGQYDQAIAFFLNTLEQKPTFSNARNNLSVAYFKDGQIEKAIQTAEAERKENPKVVGSYKNLVAFYNLSGQWEKEVEITHAAQAQNLTWPSMDTQLSATLTTLNRFDEALEATKRALREDSLDIDALNNRGVIYKQLNQIEQSIGSFNEAIQIKPDDPAAYQNLSVIYLQSGSKEKAITTLNRFLNHHPNHPESQRIKAFRNSLLN